MTKTKGNSQYDLEDRTYEFARCVRAFVKKLPRTICNTQNDITLNKERDKLIQESTELMRIFGAILQNSE